MPSMHEMTGGVQLSRPDIPHSNAASLTINPQKTTTSSDLKTFAGSGTTLDANTRGHHAT